MKKMILGALLVSQSCFVAVFAPPPSLISSNGKVLFNRSPRRSPTEEPILTAEERAAMHAERERMKVLWQLDSEDWLSDAGLLLSDTEEEPFVWSWKNIKDYLISFIISSSQD